MKNLLLKTQNPHCHFSIYRSLSSSSSSPSRPHHENKPLRLLFQQAVGFSEKGETVTPAALKTPTTEINTKLFELEKEVRDLKESGSISDRSNQNVQSEKRYSLYGLFAGGDSAEISQTERKKAEKPRVSKIAQVQRKKPEKPMVFKELSDDMRMFLTHLYKEGYFRDANFLRKGKLDFDCFNDSYGRDFIKFAAGKFGNDNQDIAKWLSGSDLKKVALFGCPRPDRKNVFSAKRLRVFFGIKEDSVCKKCVLKDSCHFANQIARKDDSKTLKLGDVMRVITIYALEALHPELSVPEEIKVSVSRLLNETLKLSQTSSQGDQS